jgi:predicted ATPase
MGQRRSERPAGNLPGSFTSFVGRRRELAEVRSRLEQSRLVTLTGVGGVGKTRLAIEAATLARRGFRDGVWFADLAAVTDPEHVPQAVASALSVPDQSTRPAADQLAAHLAGRELLLVLDNCEHQLDACAPLAEHLLRSAPQLRLLITSREALGLVGEHLVLVPPLRLPAGGRLPPLDSLTQYDAITMLRDRAAAVAPGFAITAGNHQAVVRLCTELDGLPLGIELAASRLRTMPIEQLVERLGDRFRLLTGGSRAALPRQRTLRALVDWSFELCSEPERLLWTRASVFAGGFTLAAAEGVCSGDGLEKPAVLDLLAHLVVQSVLLVEDGPGGPRYRMLETIRQYGRDRLDERGETARLRRRHRDHYLGLAEQQAAAWPGPGQEAGLAALRAEHSNLRVALDWSIRSGDCASAQRLVAALRFHWCADGFLSEGRRWLDQALLLDDTPTSARAQVLWVAAWAALLQGDHTAAAERLTECAGIRVRR